MTAFEKAACILTKIYTNADSTGEIMLIA